MKLLKESVFDLEFFENFKNLWKSPFSGDKGLNMFEAYCLYSFIRKYKPKRIKEMSPNNGFSTFVMSQAILDEGYENNIEIFDSYDLGDFFCSEAKEKSSKIKVFRFFQGDAKNNLQLSERIDFFFVDSDHSKRFAEWYVGLLESSDFIFVHDINPSEDYHLKFRGYNHEDPYCGGEPLVIYNFLRSKGYEYSSSENKTFYPRDIVSENEEGEYVSMWESIGNDDKNCEKIFWSLLNQIDFLKENKSVVDDFILPGRKNLALMPNQSLIGLSQSLFFQNV
jgi:hypothetical protein